MWELERVLNLDRKYMFVLAETKQLSSLGHVFFYFLVFCMLWYSFIISTHIFFSSNISKWPKMGTHGYCLSSDLRENYISLEIIEFFEIDRIIYKKYLHQKIILTYAWWILTFMITRITSIWTHTSMWINHIMLLQAYNLKLVQK